MKKIHFTIILLFSLTTSFSTSNDSIPRFVSTLSLGELASYKCDTCGSATGGSMGFSSMLSSNFIGVRYFYQLYQSRDGIFANSPKVDENFNTVQIWARIPVTKKLQVSAFVPYHSHNRKLSSGENEISGLGDITLLGMYTVFKTKSDSAVISQKLQLGSGLKIPTGQYKVANNLGTVNPGFQLGSGSLDYILAAEYVIQRKSLGFNAMMNYNIKTENDKNYKFGNQINYGGTFFNLFKISELKLMPQLGLAGEIYEQNRQHNQDLPDTSGDILFGKLGLELGKGSFSMGINAMLPINQNLNNGNVEAKYRWSFNLNYTL